MKQRFILLSVILLAIPMFANAQKLEFGGGLGVMHYKGDISPALNPGFARPGGNLFFRYNASKAVSARASFTGGRIYASDFKSRDPFQQSRGMIFGTRILEASADIEYNFLNFDYTRRRPKNWSPYVFAGLAFFNFQPDQEPTETYKKSGLAIPFGAGIKWQVKGPWSVGVEFGTRKTFTDYLDNYNIHGPGYTQALQSDPTRKDMYYYTSITVSYTILRVICPE